MQNARYYLNRASTLATRWNIETCHARLQETFADVPLTKDAIPRVCYIKEYDLLYNRIQKNANSNTMVLWNHLVNARMDSVIKSRNKIAHLHDLGSATLSRLGRSRSLLVIRDPYSRVLSAFLDKFRRPAIRQEHGDFDLAPAGFARFVAWLEEDGLEKNAHWDLQTKQMLLPLGRYTDVVRFERYGQGMLEFLRELGVPEEKLAFSGLVTHGARHATGADEKLAAFYDRDTRRRVAKIYEADFAALGYGI
ncbi:MAG TPA: sulfotransferase family 2 domain-containing protein [Rhizobiaceae bacterium]|nr:sulfotransferase family 2 domain-containing protein [Rhizobiaceae bacterium]